MVRPRKEDPFWAYVFDREMNDGHKEDCFMKCMFCEYTYSHGTKVTRIKAHLARFPGKGVAPCDSDGVPECVRDQAYEILKTLLIKKLGKRPSTSNNKTDNIANNETENGMEDVRAEAYVEVAAIDGLSGKKLKTTASTSNHETDNIEAGNRMINFSPGSKLEWMQHDDTTEVEGMRMHSQLSGTLQLTDPDCQLVERDCNQIRSSLVIDEGLMNQEEDYNELLDGYDSMFVPAVLGTETPLLEDFTDNTDEYYLMHDPAVLGTDTQLLEGFTDNPTEATQRTMQVGQECETSDNKLRLCMIDDGIRHDLENATVLFRQQDQGAGFPGRSTIDAMDLEETDSQVLQQDEGAGFPGRSTIDGLEQLMDLEETDSQVLHRQSMRPAREGDIPVRVKNTYNPNAPGTLITRERDMSKAVVTNIVLKRNVTMLVIFSTQMLGQFHFLATVFAIFENLGISVDVVATNEGNISLTFDPSKLWSRELIPQELEHVIEELEKIAEVHLLQHRSIVYLIGNVRRSSLILEKAFNVLRSNFINVQMISQGASKVNIALVVNEYEADPCVRALHSTFLESCISELEQEHVSDNGSASI